MKIDEFYSEVEKLNIKLSLEQKNKLEKFSNLLIEYNKHTNLTAIRDKESVLLKHFYDSLTLVKVCNFEKPLKVLDVGSGAGFPGIVLNIVFPNLNITLLDSNNKKTKFQNYIIEKLNLSNIVTVNQRAEEYYSSDIKFDIVVARAVSELAIISELCIPFVKIGGYFISMKGDSEEEIKNGQYAIEYLGGKLEKIEHFYLYNNDNIRNILLIKKINNSPKNFPRSYSKIIKKPLKISTK